MEIAKVQGVVESSTHVDVLIVGAGISGIGSAYHLQQQCLNKSYVILEMKDTFGGTWDTHRYPGVRSDSDLYTFGSGQTLGRTARRHGRGDPRLHGRGDRGERHRPAYPLRPSHRAV